jgi:hypothetical protein
MFRSPADTVTTRYLQRARRSAERKGKEVPKVKRSKIDDLPQDGGRPFNRRFLGLSHPMSPLCEFAAKQGWTLPSLCRVWSFGFNPENIANLLSHLPPTILSSINQALSSLTKLSQTNGSKLLHDTQACSKNTLGSYDSGCKAALDALIVDDVCLLQDSENAVLTMAFDVSTQIRQTFWFNQHLPILWGMNEREFQNRLVCYDLPLPFCDLDSLRIFLHHLLNDLHVPGVPRIKYVRFSSGSGASTCHMLVRWCTFSILDSQGRVTEVGSLHLPATK